MVRSGTATTICISGGAPRATTAGATTTGATTAGATTAGATTAGCATPPHAAPPRAAPPRAAATRRLLLPLLAVLAAAGCRPPLGEPIPAVAPAIPLPDVAPSHTLLLIGDAGAPELPHDPVLAALRTTAQEAPDRTTVVFLGDNIYPSGLPPADARSYERSRSRLDAQLDAFGAAGGFFVAGNHDWGGWRLPRSRSWSDQQALAREGAYLDSARGGRHPLAPTAGCAGPAVIRPSPRLAVVALDTQWWLLAAAGTPPRPPDRGDPACTPRTLHEATAYLRTALEGLRDERAADGLGAPLVVVVGHHPIESVGPHGSGGGSDQEAHSDAYLRFRMALRTAFTGSPPALYAAGHDHLLQLFAGPGARYTAVSGAGTKSDPIRRGAPWLFARSAPGFMRLDIWPGGGASLSVITVGPGDGARTAFCRWLAPAPAEGRSCLAGAD